MVEAEANPGFNAGIGQRSKTERLAWALKGAPMRKKDLRLNAIAGIAEGRKLRDRVTSLLTDAGANPEDGMVFCVFAEQDLSALVPRLTPLGVKNGASDLALVSEYVDKLPIGFLVFIWDRQDPQQSIFGHARPLIVEDLRGIDLNEKALRAYTLKIKNQLVKKGVIRDYRA
jgi:hypothetical protein